MNSHQRVKAAYEFKEPDRVPIFDAYWPETVERWRTEGLPADVSPWDHFDTDIRMITCIDHSLMLPEKIIEQTDEYIIKTDGYGITAKTFKHKTTTPHYMDFLIKTRQDWDKYRAKLSPSPDRIDWQSLKEEYAAWSKNQKYVLYGTLGLFETCWRLVGFENTLMQMVLDPDWLREIVEEITNLLIATGDLLLELGVDFDGILVSDDIAYKNGLLFSSTHLNELFVPCYKRFFGHFRKIGKTVTWHSDGKISEAIPSLINAGINCLQPLEVKAGMDVRDLKMEYKHQLVLMGNIDVRIMAQTKHDIEREIESKLPTAMTGGGYIYHSDHSIPPEVSFENYCYVIDLIKRFGTYK